MKSNRSRSATRVFARALQLVSLLLLGLAPMVLGGCAGFVSGANTTPPPPTAVNITNVQAIAITTSGSQITWTTDVASNSVVNYGTTAASYGSSTAVDPTMVTSHQVTVSALSAGTTYYYQVQSTDAKNNNGKSGGHKFATATVSISGTITPSKGGAGAMVTLSGAASATTTANSSGAYAFTGLASGSYGVTPSNTGYTFTPPNQNVTVASTNVTGVNFTDTGTAVAPAITTQPATQTVTAGQTATFTVTATGTAPLSYQWQKNGADIAGAASAAYTTPATAISDTGSTFDVVVSNSAGTATSNAATLTVNPGPVAPTITSQPTNQTVTAGQTATFTLVASGTTPLSYQWQKNGANIAGATSASYTTPATTTADSGSTFVVIVSNSAGTATSNSATLMVNPAPVVPTITTQPTNQTVTAGQAATFSVVASGTAPLSYQWQKNGANIAGATSASYTTPATTTVDSGSTFKVVVSNSSGTATSNSVTLTVSSAPVAPTINTQPTNQTVTAGQTATFSVVASGTAPLSYQWQKNGANIAGATLSSYSTAATTTSDSGSTFKVVVSNSAGSATSNAATLTVNPAPAPAIQVNPTSINFGNVVVGTNLSQSLIISNTGNATLTITQINVTGATFSATGYTLPLSINAGQQTSITVAFLPAAVSTVSGSVSIVSNAPTSPTSVGLSGSGVAATLTLGTNPTSLSFGNILTGTTSATQNVTITNTGNSNVTISQISITGAGYAVTGGTTPVTLAPSQNLVLGVQFSPTITGSVAGAISIVSNATGSPATVTLSGTGAVQHSVSLTWIASTSTVAGYNVYRSTTNGSAYVKINTSLVTGLAYTDANVTSGTTYYYVTTAVDSIGNESTYSNQASAAVP